MECIYFKSDHIVLHSHNSNFVFVFACFFASLFSFQFLNKVKHSCDGKIAKENSAYRAQGH